MGRPREGATNRDRHVNFRLNAEESAELEAKRSRRGQEVSTYFRTLMKEDDHGVQS